MSAESTVLVVDSNRGDLEFLSQQLSREGYHTPIAARPEELDQVIQGKKKAALSLIDISVIGD